MARRSRRRRENRTPRILQIGFLILLVISFAQVARWILDQVTYTNEMQARLEGFLEGEVRAAGALLEAGATREKILELVPHVSIAGQPPKIHLDTESLTAMEEERSRRINRISLEGVFFLMVLASGMVVLYRAIRQDAMLRHRQQNFLAAVSHEFKSPLASLKLSAETLSLRDPEPEARGRIVERMIVDLDRLDAMVSNILDTTRLEEGRAALRAKRVCLEEVVQSTVESLRDQAEKETVILQVDVPDHLTVEADPTALRSVLRNLIDNAIKATAVQGGGTVKVAAVGAQKFVEIEVADDGMGFPPGEGRKIFQKFYRPGEEMRRATRGSGLGLYIVARLVELARGKVSAHSAGPGTGAVIRVLWPAAREGTS